MWDNGSSVRGHHTNLKYELTRLESGRVTFVGTNNACSSTDDIRIEAVGTGVSKVTYLSEISFNRIWKLAPLFLRREFDRLGDETRDRITRAVSQLP